VKRRSLPRTLALALGVLASVPSIAAADTSFPAAARDLAAHGELLVWSPWTGSGRLMSGFGTAASPLPIPGARVLGIDLGTDARGRTVLIYSTCQVHPRRCDLRLYDFASRRHRRLSALARPGCSEEGARISRGAIVFARDCRGSSGRRLDGLYLKRPRKPVRRLRGVPRLEVVQPLGLPRLGSFDLAGGTLAFVEHRVSKGPEESTWRVTTELRALRLGRRHSRLLARERKLEAPEPSGTYIQKVRLDSGFVYWERQVYSTGDPPLVVPFRQEIVRRPVDGSAPGARLERAGRLYTEATGDRLGSYAVSGDSLYYSSPALATATPALIAQVTGTPVFR
jgi:hypothetical protein